MRKSLSAVTLLGALAVSSNVWAEDTAGEMHSHPEEKGTAPATATEEASSPHTFSYNLGLYSQYIFRGLTQTGEEPAIQGGVDYSHSSGFYLGVWGSNISWLEDLKDAGNISAYDNSSLEIDIYGGYRNSIGETGIGYDVGLLQYIYPGDNNDNLIEDAETTEVYGALSYKWLQAKVSVVVSDDAWGLPDEDGTAYYELNANIPFGESGFTGVVHVGRQDFRDFDDADYTDWKVGLTKSWSNGINVGGYYTDTNTKDAAWTIDGENIGDDQFTVFVQKTF